MRLMGIGERGRGGESVILSQLLCVATEDNHEKPQGGQAVSRPKLEPGTSPIQIRDVTVWANSLAAAAMRGKILGVVLERG